jgi:hypothetical protein
VGALILLTYSPAGSDALFFSEPSSKTPFPYLRFENLAGRPFPGPRGRRKFECERGHEGHIDAGF